MWSSYGGAPNAFPWLLGLRGQKSSGLGCTITNTRRVSLLITSAQQIGVFGEPEWGFDGRREQQQQQQQQQAGGLRKSSRVFAKWKWWGRKGESSLNKEDALPVPVSRPDVEPISKEEIQKLESCNPRKEDCKTVVYEWTGECRRCQGSGTTSFYRKKGRKVTSKCISCLGIGYVQKFTARNIEMEDLDST